MGKKRVLVGYGGEYIMIDWLFGTDHLMNNSRRRCRVGLVGRFRPLSCNDNACSQTFRINTQDGSAQNGTNVSRGIFGATIGLDRLLKLFDKHNIKATFLLVCVVDRDDSIS